MRAKIIGDATLYLGDCREILPTLPKVDAVITDPPYGIGFEYEGYKDTEINLQELVTFFVPFCREIATRLIVTCGNTNIALYPKADWYGAWTFDTTSSRGKLGWSQWQPLLFYGEDISKGTKSVGEVLKSDRIHCSVRPDQIAASKSWGHTCSKPIEFMNAALLRFSLVEETILDPFMGSGTTGVAAMQLGRKFIGIEIEPKYFDIACERIENAHRQLTLFEPARKPEQMGLIP